MCVPEFLNATWQNKSIKLTSNVPSVNTPAAHQFWLCQLSPSTLININREIYRLSPPFFDNSMTNARQWEKQKQAKKEQTSQMHQCPHWYNSRQFQKQTVWKRPMRLDLFQMERQMTHNRIHPFGALRIATCLANREWSGPTRLEISSRAWSNLQQSGH